MARHVAVGTEGGGGGGLDSGPGVPGAGDVESVVAPAPRPALPAVPRQVVPAPAPPALLARLGLPRLAAAPR